MVMLYTYADIAAGDVSEGDDGDSDMSPDAHPEPRLDLEPGSPRSSESEDSAFTSPAKRNATAVTSFDPTAVSPSSLNDDEKALEDFLKEPEAGAPDDAQEDRKEAADVAGEAVEADEAKLGDKEDSGLVPTALEQPGPPTPQ